MKNGETGAQPPQPQPSWAELNLLETESVRKMQKTRLTGYDEVMLML